MLVSSGFLELSVSFPASVELMWIANKIIAMCAKKQFPLTRCNGGGKFI